MIEIGTFAKDIWMGDNLFNVRGEVIKGSDKIRYQADGGYPGTPPEVIVHEVDVYNDEGDEIEVYDLKRNVDKLDEYELEVGVVADYAFDELQY